MKPTTSPFQLSHLKLAGYKSVRSMELELGAINLLIGANGAGKSNLISFFKLIRSLISGDLQQYVAKTGGPDALLHFGRKVTERLSAQLYFGDDGYLIELEPTVDNRLMIADEVFNWAEQRTHYVRADRFESVVKTVKDERIREYVLPAMESWTLYHFNDTGEDARVKQSHAINDNVYLRPDARNLAAYLYRLQQTEPRHYQQIVRTVQLAAPFFGGFHLRPTPANRDVIELEWVEVGQDVPFKAHMLSDGTLRFICLATLLLQPADDQPKTIIIDEPELGLHPYAITLLAALMKQAAQANQIVVSTQSVELVDEFDAEDLIVVERRGGQSTFERPDEARLKAWLEDYSLGELWKKNLLGGRPSR